MYLQGNLQVMFDALYNMGVIDPVLELDWTKELEEISEHMEDFVQIISVVNSKQNDVDEMMIALEDFDKKTLNFLAMEVAKEFADFHSRESLH